MVALYRVWPHNYHVKEDVMPPKAPDASMLQNAQLKKVTTKEKNALPTKEEIAAEKAEKK